MLGVDIYKMLAEGKGEGKRFISEKYGKVFVSSYLNNNNKKNTSFIQW